MADKLETVNLSLIVEFLESDDEFAEGEISFFEAGNRNGALVDCPNTKNELAEVFIILIRENTVEDARAKAVDV